MRKFDHIEMQVLGGAMLEEQHLRTAISMGVAADWFQGPKHIEVWEVIKQMAKEGFYVTMEGVGTRIEGHQVFLTKILDEAPPHRLAMRAACKALGKQAAENDFCDKMLRASDAVDEGNINEARDHMIQALAGRQTLQVERALSLSELRAKVAAGEGGIELIKDNYLMSGGVLMFNGPSGFGKSVLAAQMATMWSVGESFFGLVPPRPMKIFVLQAENMEEEMLDHFESIQVAFPDLDIKLSEENLRVKRDSRSRGGGLMSAIIAQHGHEPFDIIVIDNLLSYFVGNMNSQEDAARFMRDELCPTLEMLGVGCCLMSHTGKIGETKKRDYGHHTYATAGSSEFTNASRSVINLQPVEPGVAKLNFSKGQGRLPNGVDHEQVIVHGGGVHEDTGRNLTWWKVAEPEDLEKLKQTAKPKRVSKVDRIFTAVHKALKQNQTKVLYRKKIILIADAMYEFGPKPLYDLLDDKSERKALSELNRVIEERIAPHTQQREDGTWPKNDCPLNALVIKSVNKTGQQKLHQWIGLKEEPEAREKFAAILKEAIESIREYQRSGQRLPIGGQDIAPMKPGKSFMIVYSPDHRFDKNRQELPRAPELELPEGEGEL